MILCGVTPLQSSACSSLGYFLFVFCGETVMNPTQ